MGICGEVGASTLGGIALSVAGEELARGVQRMGMQARGEHALSVNQADVRQDVDVREPQDQGDRPTAMRRNSQRGAELTRVTTGQARHATTTPITVSFA
jgi:hypothetical protein